MKTDELIALLAREAGPAPRGEARRRLLPVAALGALLSAALALGVLGPVPAALWALPAPWVKLAYGGALAGVGAALALRLARPVARLGGPVALLLAVLAAVALLGAVAWATAAPDQRHAALFGHSALSCPATVLGLSLPTLAGLLWAMRGLAPTRPVAAGGAAGLLAGALAATGYALACTEVGLPFIALWYSAGIAAAGLLGAALGPRLLRW